MKHQKSYYYKLYLLAFLSIYSDQMVGQVLIIPTPESDKYVSIIKKAMIDDLLLPKSIINYRSQKSCIVSNEDRRKFDLVMCIKKNGKLEFPVYKKTILKNSYQTFF